MQRFETVDGYSLVLKRHELLLQNGANHETLLLHTVDPTALIKAGDRDAAIEELPTWTLLWDCSLLLVRQILFGDVVRGHSESPVVLDLGAGSGILTLALLKAGARHVHLVDLDADALNLARLNLSEAGSLDDRVELHCLDWNAPSSWPCGVDIIVAGDVLYSSATARALCNLLLDSPVLRPGGRFYFCDPHRGHVPLFSSLLQSDERCGRLVQHEGAFRALEGLWSDGLVLEGWKAPVEPQDQPLVRPELFRQRPSDDAGVLVVAPPPPPPPLPSQEWMIATTTE